jgi:hypothetical protein
MGGGAGITSADADVPLSSDSVSNNICSDLGSFIVGGLKKLPKYAHKAQYSY